MTITAPTAPLPEGYEPAIVPSVERYPAEQSPTMIGIYTRISSDRTGAGLGVERQLEDCKKRAGELGFVVYPDIFSDNDISAWSGVQRPDYEAMIKAFEDGLIDGVLVWHLDRLTRSSRDLENLIDLAIPVFTVMGGEIDLSSSSGRAISKTILAWIQYESDVKADRIKRKHLQLATTGAWFGQRCFGYEKDGTIVVREAAIARDLATRFLAGESLRSLTRWLNDHEVPTIRGGNWRVGTLRSILPAARMSAQREHTPGVKNKKRGAPRKRSYGFGPIVSDGQWDAILTKDETMRIRAKLSDPTRRFSVARKHLLSGGILKCGRCHQPLNRRSDPRSGDRYQCIKFEGGERCGKLSVVAAPVEQFVSDAILKALLNTRLDSPSADDTDVVTRNMIQGEAELANITENRASINNMFATGRITEPEWNQMMIPIEARQRDAMSLISTPKRTALTTLLSKWQGVEEFWAEASLDQRRAAIMSITDGISIMPSTDFSVQGHPYFNPARVVFHWK